MTTGGNDLLADEWAIYKVACIYAAGADRKDQALWRSVMTDDYVLETKDFVCEGLDANLKNIALLEDMFEVTQHKVHNQIVHIEGDHATGETYCTADHVRLVDGRREVMSWSIRYQDELVRKDGRWMFKKRNLILDWEEIRPLP